MDTDVRVELRTDMPRRGVRRTSPAGPQLVLLVVGAAAVLVAVAYRPLRKQPAPQPPELRTRVEQHHEA